MSYSNRREAVWLLMQDGGWHSTMEINAVNVGGSEGCRRLRELKKEIQDGKRPGWMSVEKRKMAGDTTQYEYRLIRTFTPPKSLRALLPPKRFPVKKGQQSLF